MDEISEKPRIILEFINERNQVTIDELKAAFPGDTLFDVYVLEEKKYVYRSFSSCELYDYQITPAGRDCLERYREKRLQREQTEHFQECVEQHTSKIGQQVDLLNTQLDCANLRLDEINRASIKRDEENAKSSKEAKIISFISLVLAAIAAFAAVAALFKE